MEFMPLSALSLPFFLSLPPARLRVQNSQLGLELALPVSRIDPGGDFVLVINEVGLAVIVKCNVPAFW